MKQCAVTTDAMAIGYLLPVWAEYYGNAFGHENLFVICYDQNLSSGEARIGNLLYANTQYNNNVRTKLFNSLVQRLLEQYSVVIRVDVDEFIAPDPRKYANLRQYVDGLNAPYVSAIGLDVVQMQTEAELRYDVKPLLRQRGFAVKAAAYSKTCVIKRPIRWGAGFHTVDAPPVFDDLYLFHMKFADASKRLDWLDYMAERCKSDVAHHTHFKAGQQEFKTTLAQFRGFDVVRGEWAIRDRTYVQKMESAVRLRADGEYYFHDLPATDSALCEIPADFAASF